MRLLDLIEAPFLRRLQSLFASYLGSSLMITDIHGTPLIQPVSGVRMCSLVRNAPRGEILCETSDRNGGHETLLSKETHVYRCLAGFIDFSAAIVFHGEVIGLLVGGQVKTGTEPAGNLEKLSRDTGLSLQELEDAYQERPCVDEDILREKLEFIKNTMEFLCDLTFLYYETHLRDVKAVADADARARTVEDIQDLFNRQWKSISDILGGDSEERNEQLRSQLEAMIRQNSSVREVISDHSEYQSCSDKNYRIREVTYELQWILTRVRAPYGELVVIPDAVMENVPPYLCGDPAAISDVLNELLLFLTKEYPDQKLVITASGKQDAYAALITVRVSCPGLRIPDNELDRIECALDGEWESLLEKRDLEYLDLTTASAVAKKLSAQLTCFRLGDEGLCMEFAVPQLPAKGGFY